MRRIALLAIVVGAAVASAEGMKPTTLRFEAAGDRASVQADRDLGALVQVFDRTGGDATYARKGTGAFFELAQHWTRKRKTIPEIFATRDGVLWCALEAGDSLSLARFDGREWRGIVLETPAAKKHRELRRGAVHLMFTERIRASDGTDVLIDPFGIFAYAGKGKWTYENVQPLDAFPVKWGEVRWTPHNSGLVVGAKGGRTLLVESGRIRTATAGESKALSDATHVSLSGGAWASFGTQAVTFASSGRLTELPIHRAIPIASRGSVVLACIPRGHEKQFVELVAQGVEKAVGSVMNCPDYIRQLSIDGPGRAWWMDRDGFHCWDDHGLRTAHVNAQLAGVTADRAYFVRSGVAFSIELAELDLALSAKPLANDIIDEPYGAISFDESGHIRAPRLVKADPEENDSLVHRKLFYRFHVFKNGAWILDASSPTYEDRQCSLRWCEECHGRRKDRARPPETTIEGKPLAVLDTKGAVIALDAQGEAMGEDARAVIRRRDGTAWIFSPAGLVELDPAATGRYRAKRTLPFAMARPWVQDSDGEVWLVPGRAHVGQLERVAFPK